MNIKHCWLIMQIQHELVLLDFWLSPFPENKQQAALEWISDIWY